MLKPHEIVLESFRIIESEVGEHDFDAQEWPVVRRIIHAAGDLDLLHAVSFTHNAAGEGVRALKAGVPIVTDVNMVAAGVHKPARAALGVDLHCYIDAPEVAQSAREQELTRSYCAMRKAVHEIGSAVYVVGNAPTALFALCETVSQGLISPQLIIAMPVGFVSVVESKVQALDLDVPVITVHGRKGGSAVATAAINALLLMAAEQT
ncbi:precorrin-8X methylmutase [Candidatus Entotheonella palauensis]|uniref:precorrin-8X methylmutase n=1 Tax=Candidatus Entotheonella palauensis TaxID=93172 RepID=UPI0015C45CA8|nr:precorrin-8X methylmutase [Candidatus Entotheonella palauensis]